MTCWLVSMEKGRLERRGILTQWTRGREREKQRKMKGGGTKTVDQDKSLAFFLFIKLLSN